MPSVQRCQALREYGITSDERMIYVHTAIETWPICRHSTGHLARYGAVFVSSEDGETPIASGSNANLHTGLSRTPSFGCNFGDWHFCAYTTAPGGGSTEVPTPNLLYLDRHTRNPSREIDAMRSPAG